MSIYDKLVGATSEGLLPPAVLDGIDTHVAQRTPTASSTTVSYWVSPTGDDSGPGSEGAPFRTLAQAASMIPDVVRADHHYTITLAAGDWGGETFLLEHRLIFGKLTVTGSTGDRELHRVHRVHVNSVFGDLRFENITATRAGTLGGPAWWFERAMPWVEVYNCKALAVDPSIRADSGVIGLLADYGSVVHAEESDFNGRRYGLRANYSSRIYSKRNTGTGNVFAVGARWGGIMNTYGSQPGADTTYTTDSGGMISRGKGGKVGNDDELFLSEAHESSEGRIVSKKWLVRSYAPTLPTIGDGQRLRLTFRKNDSNAPHMMEVKWAGSPVVGTAIRHVRTIIAAMITDTDVQSVSSTPLAGSAGSGGNTADMVQLSHSGADSIFYIDIVPPAALESTWYGVDVDISNMRNWNAPTLLDAQVV